MKVLSLALVLALIGILAIPSAVVAGESGSVTISGKILPVITSISPVSGVQGNSNISITISGSNFSGASGVSLGDGVTVSNIAVSSDQITATITIGSNATAEKRDVSVTVFGATGTMVKGFEVVAMTFTISAPQEITLGNMDPKQTKRASSETQGSVSTNADKWQITVKDASDDEFKSGHMIRKNDTINKALTNPFRIGFMDNSYSNSKDGFTINQQNGTSLQLFVEQEISTTDAAGEYSIVIKFDGTPN